MDTLAFVDKIDHGRHCGGLAGTCGSCYQHQSMWPHGESFNDGWQAELLEFRNAERNHPDGHGDGASLEEDIGAESCYAGYPCGHIDGAIGQKLFVLRLGHQVAGQLFGIGGCEFGVAQGLQAS